MQTYLNIDLTIEKVCVGFVYNEYEGKGLFGLAGIECSQAAADMLSGVVTFPLVLSFFRKLPEDGEPIRN